MEKAVRWAIVSATQAELPEHASTTCTIFALPENKASAYTKLLKHPSVTIIDTIPAGYHVYAEADTWTGGKHQPHKNKPTPLIIFAITNTAGHQHLHGHSTPFIKAWNEARKTTQGNMGKPTQIKSIPPPNSHMPPNQIQAPKKL